MGVMALVPTRHARPEEGPGTPVRCVRHRCDLAAHQPCGGITVARAIDSETLVLGPAWWAMPPAARLLVLAHEVAHTVQLGREGDDPSLELEREAWDAAAAVLAGRRFEVRGAASRALDARAFVAANMAAARPFYERFPQEPVGDRQSVAIDSVVQIAATASAFFAALRRDCRRGDVVLIVAHSSEHGVALRLVAGSDFGLNVDNVNRIMGVLTRPEATRAAATAELARDARLGLDAASALLADIGAVRALGLAAVHFRGCNLGAWEDTPRTFRGLFGCPLVTGLNLRSAYASMSPGALTGTPQARARRFGLLLGGRSQARTIIEGEPGSRFGYRYTVNLERHSLSFASVVAESEQAGPLFIRRHLPAPRPAYTRGPIPIHALISVGDLIYPYANGVASSEYTSHIQASRPGTDIL